MSYHRLLLGASSFGALACSSQGYYGQQQWDAKAARLSMRAESHAELIGREGYGFFLVVSSLLRHRMGRIWTSAQGCSTMFRGRPAWVLASCGTGSGRLRPMFGSLASKNSTLTSLGHTAPPSCRVLRAKPPSKNQLVTNHIAPS